MPRGSLDAPLGTAIWQDTTGTWCRSRSQMLTPFFAAKTTGPGGRKGAGIGVSGRGPSTSGAAVDATGTTDAVGRAAGAGGATSRAPPHAGTVATAVIMKERK